MIAVLLS